MRRTNKAWVFSTIPGFRINNSCDKHKRNSYRNFNAAWGLLLFLSAYSILASVQSIKQLLHKLRNDGPQYNKINYNADQIGSGKTQAEVLYISVIYKVKVPSELYPG